jgi:response regulator RpfG family c-di-GMP phosphodiesterase
MSKQIASSPAEILTVLSVSPLEEDHFSLQAILGHTTWMLFKADRVPPALAFLQRHEVSVVLCERDLTPETWIEMRDNIRHVAHPPSLIVTSRVADERLWAEVLNLGAWGVLSKPFNHGEVLRSVKSAWQHRHDQTQWTMYSCLPRQKVMPAAG